MESLEHKEGELNVLRLDLETRTERMVALSGELTSANERIASLAADNARLRHEVACLHAANPALFNPRLASEQKRSDMSSRKSSF